MNRHEPFLPRGRQAKIRYLDADFQVLSEGDHVICAVTGVPIKIEQLTYWSVARQEPYLRRSGLPAVARDRIQIKYLRTGRIILSVSSLKMTATLRRTNSAR